MAESNFTPGMSISQTKNNGSKSKRSQHPIAQAKPHHTTANQSPTAFTLKEIKALQKNTNSIKQLSLVQTQHKTKTRYEIHFVVQFQNKCIHAILITTRHKPYQLANLDRGIKFIQSLFIGAEVIELKL